VSAPVRARLVRDVHWAGLAPGDAVVVDRPKERRSTFAFVAFVRNTDTGDEWVEVRGGRNGEMRDRSFSAESVYPASARKGPRLVGAPLMMAPQLPFTAG